MPALDEDGEETFLRLGSIRGWGAVDSAGLQTVTAKDDRLGLKAGGWALTCVGALLAVPLILRLQSEPARGEGAHLGLMYGVVALAALVLPGPTLLAVGYGSSGPEFYRPSTDLPRSVRDPLP